MLGFAGMIILATSACVIGGIDFAATDVPGKISPAAEQALNVLQNDVFPGNAGRRGHLPPRQRVRDRDERCRRYPPAGSAGLPCCSASSR